MVLLDEIEKAHPDVWNMLLQIMEEGRLTDNVGRHVDFKNTILIMTTNIGADHITNQSEFGFGKRDDGQLREDEGPCCRARSSGLPAEFLNRVDDLIVFRKLKKDDLKTIVDIELAKVAKRSRNRTWSSSSTRRPRTS